MELMKSLKKKMRRKMMRETQKAPTPLRRKLCKCIEQPS